jgi:hypothetical protein
MAKTSFDTSRHDWKFGGKIPEKGAPVASRGLPAYRITLRESRISSRED